MPEDERWPRFELVTYTTPKDIPHGWDRDLIALGAPKRILGSYEAMSQLELIEHPTLGPLVRFATIGIRRQGAMCLHPATGSIRHLTGARSGQESFVNTTLAQFNESVHSVINRFPFDHGLPSNTSIQDVSAQWPASRTDQREDVDWIAVGEELRELLRCIDPKSVADPNYYWSGFVDDVEMGNYSTDAVLNFPRQGGIVSKRSAQDRHAHEN